MGKKIDLTGQRFGKLIVIKETTNPNSKKQATFWECQCDCGNKTISVTSSLLSKKKYQCADCGRLESDLKRRKDLTGERFGKLVVKEMIYGERSKSGRLRTYCICECDCGNVVKRLVDGLKKDSMCSCGCARKEISDKLSIDIIGEKYGRLTVIEELKDFTPRKVKCRCECGNIVNVTKTDIMNYHTLSCGCLKSENTSKSNLKDWSGVISLSNIEFIDQAYKNEHGTWLWNCKCTCGNSFIALPANIMSGKVSSCGCKNQSSGEVLIQNILDEYNIKYQPQYTFSDCKDEKLLRFDFAIFTSNKIKLIEFDGAQHFKPIDWFDGEEGFKKRILHDSIKDNYCLDNDIPLLRLKYNLSIEEIKNKIIEFIAP